MLRAIVTALALVSLLVGVVAWFVGFVSAAKAFAYRGRQALSTEVKALQRSEGTTAAEQAERFVPVLKRRMLKCMLVFFVAIAVTAGLILLRDWATGGSS